MSSTGIFAKFGTAVGLVGLGAALLASPATAQDRTYRGERGGGNSGYGQGGNGQTDRRSDRGAVTRQPNGNLEARLETDRTQYRPGRAVEITVSLTNVSRYETNLLGRSPLYEITIRDSRGNRTVYTTDSRRGNGTNRGLRLAADETRTWRELWDGRGNDGERLPSGTYLIEARIAGQRAVSTQIYLGENSRPGRPGQDDGDWGNGGGGGGGRPGGGSGGNPERPNWPTRPPIGGGDVGRGETRSLRATLTASRTVVRPGDSVRLTYTVQNAGSGSVSLRFMSGRRFDIRAAGPNGRQVWQDSDGKFTTQALQTITIRPGAEEVFTTTWAVPRGTATGRYEFEGFLTPQQVGGGSGRAATADLTLRVVNGNAVYEDERDNDGYGRRNGRDGYQSGDGGYGDYENRRNRVPPGVISGGGLGGPIIVYPSRTGALLVTPRALVGTGGTQYIGKKVTVSGRCASAPAQAGNASGPVAWTLGGEGVLLPVVGVAPATGVGGLVTVTGVLRQRPDGSVYLSIP